MARFYGTQATRSNNFVAGLAWTVGWAKKRGHFVLQLVTLSDNPVNQIGTKCGTNQCYCIL